MAVVVCGIWRNYDTGAEVDEVSLWGEKAGVRRFDDYYDDCGDGDDTADNSVLFRASVADIGSGKFTDTTDFTVGDGTGVLNWSGGGDTGCRNDGGVVCSEAAGFSYCGGGIFWSARTVFGEN